MPSDRVEEAIRAVSRFLIADATLGTTLERIAKLAQGAIDGADAIGVTLLNDATQPITAVCTDRISPSVDQAQYDEGTGPCLDAYREGRVVRVDDTRDVADRWPSFSERAVAEGVLSTLALPLNAGEETFGVFNLYSTKRAAFVDHEDGDAALFVTQAAVVLANARAYWNMFQLADGLRTAVSSRAAIEQAKGLIMARTGVTAEEAFTVLRTRAQAENRRLRDIALDVAGHEDPPT